MRASSTSVGRSRTDTSAHIAVMSAFTAPILRGTIGLTPGRNRTHVRSAHTRPARNPTWRSTYAATRASRGSPVHTVRFGQTGTTEWYTTCEPTLSFDAPRPELVWWTNCTVCGNLMADNWCSIKVLREKTNRVT